MWEPHLIKRIEDGEGNVLWESETRETRVWSEGTAYVMLDLLHGNVTDARRVQPPRANRRALGGGQNGHDERRQGSLVRRHDARHRRGGCG